MQIKREYFLYPLFKKSILPSDSFNKLFCKLFPGNSFNLPQSLNNINELGIKSPSIFKKIGIFNPDIAIGD